MRTSRTRLLDSAALRLVFLCAPRGLLFLRLRSGLRPIALGLGSPLRLKRLPLMACAAAEPALVRIVAALFFITSAAVSVRRPRHGRGGSVRYSLLMRSQVAAGSGYDSAPLLA